MKFVLEYVQQTADKPEFFLLRYNRRDGTIVVRPYSESIISVRSFDRAEVSSIQENDRNSNFVLVNADNIETLKSAYPNYFGDVQYFKDILQGIVKGAPQQFVLPPQPTAPKKPYEKPANPSWMRGNRHSSKRKRKREGQ